MLTTILAALAGQFSSLINNPIARKIGMVAILGAALWYGNKLLTNHAYEQGKADGAKQAWVQAEEAQNKIWAEAQKNFDVMQKQLDAQAKQLEAKRADFDKRHAVVESKKAAVTQKVEAEVTKAESTMAAAQPETDGLPPKQVIYDALLDYKDAYESTLQELQWTEAQYDESVKLMDESIAERGRQIDVLTKELDLTKKQAEFYKTSFEQATRKHGGFGHFLKRVLTLGIAR